jgi:S-adenosylmethionine:diacylglycerol 3-amino-3-carboxypropyl transferase
MTIEINALSSMDCDLVVQFTNATRDLSYYRLIHKPLVPVSKATQKKIWSRFQLDAARPISEISRALYRLRNFADSSALRSLAEKAIEQDPSALKELRSLGIKLKQDLV